MSENSNEHSGKENRELLKYSYTDENVLVEFTTLKDIYREFDSTCKNLKINPNTVLNSLCQNFSRLYSGQVIKEANAKNIPKNN